MNKKAVIPILLSLLSVSTLCLVAFSVQSMSNIKSSNSQIAGLNSTISALKRDMTSMRTLTSGISSGESSSLTQIIALVEPAVVRIDVNGPGFVDVGSGFIVDESGYVVTNQHVIEDAFSIIVTLSSGESYPAKVDSADANRDVALIKMISECTDFPVIELGTANDSKVGASLFIGGFPLGLELSGRAAFTQGIVSAIRTIDGLQFIQTDAPINPGNSGGPVIDMQGTLIGVCVSAVINQGMEAEGLGLVIPVSDVLSFIDSGIVSCSNRHYSA
jgi:S1-C subfamily serine protease